MRLTLVTAAAAAPVELASAKLHCRVDSDEEDTMIQSLIDSATAYLDGPSGILGRTLMPQTWQLELTAWPDSIVLPIEPVRAVAITYTDTAGDEQALDAATYSLSAWPGRAPELRFVSGAVRPDLGQSEYPIAITMQAGFADADSVPSPIKTAILMLVAHWYKNREAVSAVNLSNMPSAFDALIAGSGRRLV